MPEAPSCRRSEGTNRRGDDRIANAKIRNERKEKQV